MISSGAIGPLVPKRIVIVGFPGSGKSTLGHKLSQEFSLPHIEADQLFWKNKTEHVTDEELISLVEKKLSENHEWIFEGHFKTLHQVVLKQATAVIEIDKSFWSSFFQYALRELKRSDVGFVHKFKQIAFVARNYSKIKNTREKALADFKGLRIGQ